MSERNRNRDRSVEDQWGLRTDRAQRAFGRFCLSWIGASRQLGFGSAHLMLRTAEDLSDGACPAQAREVEERRTSTTRADDTGVVREERVEKVSRRRRGA